MRRKIRAFHSIAAGVLAFIASQNPHLKPEVMLLDSTASAQAADVTESRADRADRLRRQSRSRGAAPLGYETVGDPNEVAPHLTDYHALGAIISRLGNIIQNMQIRPGQGTQAGPHIPGLPSLAMGQDAVSQSYGPNGPTVESVRALLAYRLVTLGNPNLKIGTVTDKGAHVAATVVTRDNSLVASYRVNKKDGSWTPVNGSTQR